MSKEIWKNIPDYIGLYQASNLGRVRSLDRVVAKNRKIKGRVLKLSSDKDGYKQAVLCKKGKTKTQRVHRLIFLSFKGFMPKEVNHINGIKDDNNVINLESSDRKRNAKHASINNLYRKGSDHSNSKLNENKLLSIVIDLKLGIETYKQISKKHNVSCTVINNINNGTAWVGFTKEHTSKYPIRCEEKKPGRMFSKKQILDMRKQYRNGISCKEIAEKIGSKRQSVSSIVNYRNYKDIE